VTARFGVDPIANPCRSQDGLTQDPGGVRVGLVPERVARTGWTRESGRTPEAASDEFAAPGRSDRP